MRPSIQYPDNQHANTPNRRFSTFISSDWLKRKVRLELVDSIASGTADKGLLLLNDGQDLDALVTMPVMSTMISRKNIRPITLVAIHAGERKAEYGVSGIPDYLDRGAKAYHYEHFIKEELLHYLKKSVEGNVLPENTFFAGCSLGGLSAFDIAVSNPEIFGGAGVFSGSFWWRSKGYESGYTQNDRIIFNKLKSINMNNNFRCWLMAGSDDERNDRNRNGIIDSVNDTLDIYDMLCDMTNGNQRNIQLSIAMGGRHHPVTWKKHFPEFLIHAFGMEINS